MELPFQKSKGKRQKEKAKKPRSQEVKKEETARFT